MRIRSSTTTCRAWTTTTCVAAARRCTACSEFASRWLPASRWFRSPQARRLSAARGLGLSDDVCGTVVAMLMRASGAGGMIGGQLLDLDGEDRPLGLAELERIHRAKTGALIRRRSSLGGLAARADRRRMDALSAFGAGDRPGVSDRRRRSGRDRDDRPAGQNGRPRPRSAQEHLSRAARHRRGARARERARCARGARRCARRGSCRPNSMPWHDLSSSETRESVASFQRFGRSLMSMTILDRVSRRPTCADSVVTSSASSPSRLARRD